MKKLLLTVSALVALSLLAPSTGFAYHNQVGFYTAPDNMIPQISNPAGSFNVYVVLHEPYNVAESAQVQTLGGFEFQLTVPASVFVLGASYPTSATNVANDPGEYIVGYGLPLTVDDYMATTLVTFNVLASAAGDPDLFVYVSASDTPSIADNISYLDKDFDDIIAMHNACGGLLTEPIFAINPAVDLVAIEELSFDAVKALYR